MLPLHPPPLPKRRTDPTGAFHPPRCRFQAAPPTPSPLPRGTPRSPSPPHHAQHRLARSRPTISSRLPLPPEPPSPSPTDTPTPAEEGPLSTPTHRGATARAATAVRPPANEGRLRRRAWPRARSEAESPGRAKRTVRYAGRTGDQATGARLPGTIGPPPRNGHHCRACAAW
ncbi:predicted protein [Streptomyces sp. SPB78]|nr:predicted protein [Streptomyces sp. SPB78]